MVSIVFDRDGDLQINVKTAPDNRGCYADRALFGCHIL
jgi:hypothetical protein